VSQTLYQLHWQNRANFRETEFVAQGGPFRSVEDFRAWINDVMGRRRGEMPDGWQPLVVSDGSDLFVLAASPGGQG
jgi:hypothetical protein